MIPPTWEALANGNITVARAGVLLLEFAAASASQGSQAGYGSRSYDWSNKQVRRRPVPKALSPQPGQPSGLRQPLLRLV